MDPTPQSGPKVVGASLVEFIRTQRQTAAYVMLVFSVLFLVGAIGAAYRTFRGAKAAPEVSAETSTPDAPKPPEIADVKRGDYTVAWIASLTGFLVTSAAGAWLLVGLPAPTEEKQRTDARKMILAVGAAVGTVLILAGLLYFYRWSDSLAKWLDKGETKEAKWVIIPLLIVVVGAGVILTAIQPARAEERNDPKIRKTVYWSNFGLTTLLLLVGLVVTNVIFALKVTNRLDTTETGFYSLGESTKAFLAKLPQPVTAYLIMPDDGRQSTDDIRQLLLNAEEASEKKFRVKPISPVANKSELNALLTKYPKIDPSVLGVLLTAGEDEKRHAFIPRKALIKTEQGPNREEIESFDGENQLMKELRFLAENEQRPVIYFTQSNGEMSIGGGAEAAIGAKATMLKAYLEKAYYDVRPLLFDPQNPTVPADATVVIVAEPRTPLSAAAAGALRKYMTTPQPDGRKGKLIVLAGATPGADGKGVSKTGLEELLAEFNVRIGDKFIYSERTQGADFQSAVAAFARASEQNPITKAIAVSVPAFRFNMPREVAPLTANPAFQAAPLLLTSPGRLTWLEDDRIGSYEAVAKEMNEKPAVASRKQLSERPRSVAVVVSEASAPSMPGAPPSSGGAGRILAIGNSDIIADEATRGLDVAPSTFDLMSVAIDWLRDRPVIPTNIDSKRYKVYRLPAPETMDNTRLLWFPLGLAILTVAGLGTALWAVRRK